jgi:chromosome segregation ATPase
MEPVVLVFLSTAVGTIVGVACAFLLMQRRNRGPAGEGADGKSPQNLASVVAAPTVTIDDVRKLLAERDQTLQQCRDDLEKKHQQLEAATVAAESAAALRAQAEQRSSELAIQVSAFSDQIKELAAKTQEGGIATEEAGRQTAALESQLDLEKAQNRESAEQIAHLSDELAQYKSAGAGAVTSLEGQLDAEKLQIQELTEQVARLNNELTGYRVVGVEAVTSLEEQLDSEKKQSVELAEQVAVLTIDLNQARQYCTDADGYRSSLETELGVGRLRIAQLTDQVAELNRELEAQLDSEQQQSRGLTEQIVHLSTELTEYRAASADAVAQLEEQLDLEQKQGRALAEQVAALATDLGQAKQSSADGDSYRSSLEAELGVGRLRIMQLTDQIAELNRERAGFEVRLREERQSAARGIELLSLVQSTLSGAVHRLKEEQHVDGAAQSYAMVATAEPVEVSPVEPHMEDLVAEPVEVEAEASVAVSA